MEPIEAKHKTPKSSRTRIRKPKPRRYLDEGLPDARPDDDDDIDPILGPGNDDNK